MLIMSKINFILLIMSCVSSESISDDLVPYMNGGHLDQMRNHRYVRECLKTQYGELTYESIKPIEIDSTFITNYIGYETDHLQFGHRTVIKNPLKMLSVLEPLKSGGCKTNSLAYVHESAKQQNCRIAVNAGFFNPFETDKDYGKCYGNIISNGNLVQDNGGIQNANFGIRSDGTLVIGYLPEKEVIDKKNPFLQLLSGVGWILRNGSSYLKESEKAECKESETTGTLDKFFNVKSARTMIGYDAKGHVHIVQFDGKTGKSGINLYEAVEYLKKIGLINAINFDGGGSATYVQDSIILNYPSNECAMNGAPTSQQFNICPKPVSTIICVHDEQIAESYDASTSMSHCCNRNYVLVVVLSSVIAVCLLAMVFIFNSSSVYNHRVKDLFGGQKDALKSLLESNEYSTDGDSEKE